MSLTRFFRRARWDAERARELQDYLAHEIDDNIARGMSADAATKAAHLKLGNATRIREEIYEMNTLPIDALWRDLRYGMRLLLKNPTFTAVAILTLALGTGANAAIFQLVNAMRLRPLPVERPEELVSIGIDTHGAARVGIRYGPRAIHSEPLWQTLRTEQQAFSSVFAWSHNPFDLSTDGEFRPASGLFVSGSYFGGLGVAAHVGRLLTDADDRKGCSAPGAVLSYGFWQARYGGNAGVIGQTIVLERRRFDIVGVTPPGFFGVEVGRSFDVAVPLCAELLIREAQLAGTGRPHVAWLDVMGRLKPDWTIARAAAHLAALSPGIFAATVPPSYNVETARQYSAFTFTATAARSGVSALRTEYATELWVLLGATALVLLITCANLANLMLARATARQREIAVRLAIGASRSRIVRQMLSESLLIAAFGALAGLLLAGWLSESLVAFLSTESNRVFVDLTPDWRLFTFIAAIAVSACLLFGLSPALRATDTAPAETMQAGGRSSTDSPEAFTLRRGLVVVQVALSLVLIVGALLFARSLRNLIGVDVGFRPEGIVAVNVDLRRSAVRPEGRHDAFSEITARVRAVPGVRHAAEALIVPLSGPEWNSRITIAGVRQEGNVYFNQIGGDFFRAFEMPLVEGRTFDIRDRRGAPLAAVVNQTFARRFLPGTSPIGRTFQVEVPAGQPPLEYHVVGLVTDTKYENVREELKPIAYLAYAQEPEPLAFLYIIIRSETALGSLRPALTRTIVDAAPGAAVSYDTIANYVRDSLVTERVMASLSAFFGLLAMLIATIGLYGVMSYTVTRRKVEIGIRMALGADPGAVIRMVLRESGVLLVTGIAAGIVLAIVVSRSAATLLYGLEPWDPVSFAIAAGVLGAVSIMAAWIPARRASRVPPTTALRE
jgi:putative ABC transport system permease protein